MPIPSGCGLQTEMTDLGRVPLLDRDLVTAGQAQIKGRGRCGYIEGDTMLPARMATP
jgi:hypothetical protein